MLGKLYKLLPLGKPLKKGKKSQANGMEGFKSAGMFLENRTDEHYGVLQLFLVSLIMSCSFSF